METMHVSFWRRCLRHGGGRRIDLPQRMLYGLLWGVTMSLGCDNVQSTAVPPPLPAAQLFWKLNLNHHAVTLSVLPPTDTVQLVATPLNPAGTPLAGGGPVTYTVMNNDTSVQVSATGLVTAHSPENGVQVVATQTVAGETLTDTVLLNIFDVASVPVLTTFSIQPLPGDSVKVDCSGVFTKLLDLTMLDRMGATIATTGSTPVLVHFWSSDITIANDTRGIVLGVKPGQVTLYAETDVYGVSKSDSLRFTITPSIVAAVLVKSVTLVGHPTPVSAFAPSLVSIGVGGYVIWVNRSLQPVDVVFDDSTMNQASNISLSLGGGFDNITPSGGGNISAFASTPTAQGFCFNFGTSHCIGNNVSRSRQFPMAGTYHYHSALYGTTGTVQVGQP